MKPVKTEEAVDRVATALEALSDPSSGVRDAVLRVIDAPVQLENRTGVSTYQGGPLGEVAGVLAKYAGEVGNPAAWKDWMGAAAALVEEVGNQ